MYSVILLNKNYEEEYVSYISIAKGLIQLIKETDMLSYTSKIGLIFFYN